MFPWLPSTKPVLYNRFFFLILLLGFSESTQNCLNNDISNRFHRLFFLDASFHILTTSSDSLTTFVAFTKIWYLSIILCIILSFVDCIRLLALFQIFNILFELSRTHFTSFHAMSVEKNTDSSLLAEKCSGTFHA